MRRVDMLLQRLEVGDAGRQHEGDFAVDQRVLAGKLRSALAMAGKRTVQSSPLRLNRVISSPAFRAMMR